MQKENSYQLFLLMQNYNYVSPAAVDEALLEVVLDSFLLLLVRLLPFAPLLFCLGLLPSRRFFFFLTYLFCLVANSVNVIVTSLTVTECCVNLFLSIISPVLPLEVGGEYLIKFPFTSSGVTLNGFSEAFVERGVGAGEVVWGSGVAADEEEGEGDDE